MCAIHVLTNCPQESRVFFEDEKVAGFERDSSLKHLLRLVGIAEFGYEKDCIVAKKCGVAWVGNDSLYKHLLRPIKVTVVL